MPVSSWSSTASSNTSVGGLTTDGNIQTVNNIDGMFRGMMADIATARDDGTMTTYVPRGYLFGLTLSNNTGDATNDIDIAAGEAAADTSPYRKITLASALTKRLDAAWAVGTNQGGLDTGAIADTTYHIWLIQRSDTGVVDVLFSASATAPTMPANYDRKRRIGSILRRSGAITQFRQTGDNFMMPTGIVDRSSTAAFPSGLLSLSVPSGIVVMPLCILTLTGNASSNSSMKIGGFSEGSAAHTVITSIVAAAGAGYDVANIPPVYPTNTSSQIYFELAIISGTVSGAVVQTVGWVDTRGRNS